jgi:hypothetical protein
MHSLKNEVFDKLDLFLQHEQVKKNHIMGNWTFIHTSILVLMCIYFTRKYPAVDLD